MVVTATARKRNWFTEADDLVTRFTNEARAEAEAQGVHWAEVPAKKVFMILTPPPAFDCERFDEEARINFAGGFGKLDKMQLVFLQSKLEAAQFHFDGNGIQPEQFNTHLDTLLADGWKIQIKLDLYCIIEIC